MRSNQPRGALPKEKDKTVACAAVPCSVMHSGGESKKAEDGNNDETDEWRGIRRYIQRRERGYVSGYQWVRDQLFERVADSNLSNFPAVALLMVVVVVVVVVVSYT